EESAAVGLLVYSCKGTEIIHRTKENPNGSTHLDRLYIDRKYPGAVISQKRSKRSSDDFRPSSIHQIPNGLSIRSIAIRKNFIIYTHIFETLDNGKGGAWDDRFDHPFWRFVILSDAESCSTGMILDSSG
ncbi:methylenetetrahydrofolate dehydrogenase, partial [Moniliophthora roreri]